MSTLTIASIVALTTGAQEKRETAMKVVLSVTLDCNEHHDESCAEDLLSTVAETLRNRFRGSSVTVTDVGITATPESVPTPSKWAYPHASSYQSAAMD